MSLGVNRSEFELAVRSQANGLASLSFSFLLSKMGVTIVTLGCSMSLLLVTLVRLHFGIPGWVLSLQM